MIHLFCSFLGILILFSLQNVVLGNQICANNSNPWEGEANNRIPGDVFYATHYELYLNPDLSTELFSGHVNIHITTFNATDYFLVNIKDIEITAMNLVQIGDVSNVTISIINACEYEENEYFVIETATTADEGEYQLYLEYTGTLADKIIGFYYSTYVDNEGNTIPLATTKFEPTYARQAFPCFDEPSFRSTYQVTIVKPSDEAYIGLSNMPVEKTVVDSPTVGKSEIHFETSVSMVTYLVCFIVCDFQYKESILDAANGSLPFRVYSPSEQLSNMQYALDFGATTLLYYETLFDYPFPLPKSDMAAIPDYSSGATEHWGIITFRETNIFYNETTSSSSNYQRVSSVIAHEMAHQWFGNLVTLMWWNDLWLNEGFASYVQNIGVDHVHPEWDMEAQFVINNLQYVFDLDSKTSSHAIVKDVTTPDEINAMFDSISYDKGSTVLRMCEGFMGATDFQNGINNFIKKYAFKNAVTQNLWDELQAAWTQPADRDITEIMDTWTVQMGYPVVSVDQPSASSVRFYQTRFYKDPNTKNTTDVNVESPIFRYKWDIPISILTSTGNIINVWFNYNASELFLDLGENVEWFKVNVQQKGYYRVQYANSDGWSKMGMLLSLLALDVEDRASLYDDCFALADSSVISYDVPLDLSIALKNENHYVPWAAAAKRLETNIYLLLTTDNLDDFKSYSQSLVDDIYDTLKWGDGGTHLNSLLRYEMVELACFSGLDSCLQEAGDLLQVWIDEGKYDLLPLDTRRKIFWWGQIQAGSPDNWNTMWNRCIIETDPTARNNLYYGLSNSQNTTILNNYITLAQNDAYVKSQDFLSILEYISLNPAGMDLVWNWTTTQENWDWLVDRYTLNDRYLGGLIPFITQYFATEEKLQEMNDFFEANPEAGAGEQDRVEAIDTVNYNIYWVNTNSVPIGDWLSVNGV